MNKTDRKILEQLDISIDEILTLEALDDKVQAVLDQLDSDYLTNMNDGYGADETLADRYIRYYPDETIPFGYEVFFELVEAADDPVMSKVKII